MVGQQREDSIWLLFSAANAGHGSAIKALLELQHAEPSRPEFAQINLHAIAQKGATQREPLAYLFLAKGALTDSRTKPAEVLRLWRMAADNGSEEAQMILSTLEQGQPLEIPNVDVSSER